MTAELNYHWTGGFHPILCSWSQCHFLWTIMIGFKCIKNCQSIFFFLQFYGNVLILVYQILSLCELIWPMTIFSVMNLKSMQSSYIMWISQTGEGDLQYHQWYLCNGSYKLLSERFMVICISMFWKFRSSYFVVKKGIWQE